MPELDRRRFLAGVGALVAAPTAARVLPDQPAPAGPPFDWGVASFDPTTDAVLLWTRLDPDVAGPTATLRWVVATDEALSAPVAEGQVEVTARSDHCARVAVEGLEPGRRWWYAFTAPDGRQSPVGRTVTLPLDPTRLRLALASCARFADGAFTAYRAISDLDVDLVVHLGDYVYEDGIAGARPHEPAHRLTTLADYRTRYAQHRLDPDLQALHARHPMVATWDDHEIASNAWRDGAAGHVDGRDGPWPARREAATQAHDEWLPGRTTWADDGRLRAWRALDLGGLAELVVLDTRLWGRERQARTAEELDRPRSLLGEDQAAFVAEHLGREDRAPWVLVANQVMLHPLSVPLPSGDLGEQLAAAGYVVAAGAAVNPDQWDGYRHERDRLLEAAGDRGGVVVLTGDVHSSWAWAGAGADGDPALVELVTPSVTSGSFASRIPAPPELVEVGLRALERDLAHVELSNHGFVVVDLTADRVVGEWWHVVPGDPGSVRFHAARSAPRRPPMRLVEESEPTAARSEQERAAAPKDPEGGREGRGAITAAAAAALAAVAGAIALRRRTARR